jgi:hypothetical protein
VWNITPSSESLAAWLFQLAGRFRHASEQEGRFEPTTVISLGQTQTAQRLPDGFGFVETSYPESNVKSRLPWLNSIRPRE